MRILIDILHPAHVHVFKHFFWEMEKRGHKILVTARDKDITLKLLDDYQIPYEKISKIAESKIGLFAELFSRNFRLTSIARKFRPDIFMGCMGASISLIGKILNIPSVVFYNNETARMVLFYAEPLSTIFVTASSYETKVRGRHITHDSYHELAYLHPNRFKADESVLWEVDLDRNECFFVVRFVSWQSSHDIGGKGFSNKEEFVKNLEKRGRVIVTSEKPLPRFFEKYRVSLAPERMHDLLSFATLCIGESATMAAEAAVLGVPAIYVANTKRGYTNELEKKYDLVYNFDSQEDAMFKALELLKMKNLQSVWHEKMKRMLKERGDMTSWMIEFIENKGWKCKFPVAPASSRSTPEI